MKLSEFDFDLPEELIANYPSENRDDARLMVIHRETGKIEHKLFSKIEFELGFYFVHAYYFDPYNSSNILGTTFYSDEFCSAVFNDNIFGVQFHPEKSHSNGIQLLTNFARL